MTPDQRPLTLGTRLIVGKHAATIRYVGPVEGQQGEWVGLEWDEASRGKHDGSHSGVRYFSCARGPTAGSLVRLPKLLEGADLGQPLAAAIQARYKNANEDAIENDEAYVPTASHRHVPIQLVGAEAAAAVVSGDGNLHQASFVGMKVSSLVRAIL